MRDRDEKVRMASRLVPQDYYNYITIGQALGVSCVTESHLAALSQVVADAVIPPFSDVQLFSDRQILSFSTPHLLKQPRRFGAEVEVFLAYVLHLRLPRYDPMRPTARSATYLTAMW